MGSKSTMVGFILFGSLYLSAVLATCPPVNDCPENEERACRRICSETCQNLHAGIDCILPEKCLTRCYCKAGYLRVGENGPCVPRDKCDSMECINDVNAHRGCGDKCGKTCANYKSAPACPKPNCTTYACDCNTGFLYDENLRLCVKPENCTKTCKTNEWFSPCPIKGCEPETCDDLGKPRNCPLLPPGPCPIPGACTCRYGYVKDKNGICIDAKTCPSCGGDPNAQAGCEPCSKTCASLYSNETNPKCPPCDNLGCHCKEGYYLDTDSKPPKCVLPKECPQNNIKTTPSPPVCPENEERDCRRICSETCQNLHAGIDCILPKKCLTRCYCKAGYLRVGENGPCVPSDKCDSMECINDVNAHRGCGDKCGKTCANYKSAPACPKPNCTTYACDCNTGFLYDENLRLCVKPENCTETCKANEWFSPCPIKGCEPETCDDLGKPRNCPLLPPGPCPIPGACTCRYGYVKDKNGICIDAKTCPSCGGDPNAQAGCEPCSKTCASLYSNETNPKCPPCDNLGCHCKEGYYLDTDSKPPKCVLRKECPQNNIKTTPSPPVCPENEERDCRRICSETCQNLHAGIDCILPEKCLTRCYCKAGYLRVGENGPCVPSDKCDSMECINDVNAHRGCGDKCGKTCANYKSAQACPKPNCTTYACDCNTGFLYDENLRLCVKPENCTETCKTNEWFSPCPIKGCQPETCDDLGKPRNCPLLPPGPCPIPGACTCRYGYVKDKNGICIDAKTCPSCGGDPNAQAGCEPCSKTCASLYSNETNPKCPPCDNLGCHCKEGYYLDTDSKPPKCVLPKQCPQNNIKTTPSPPVCPENEVRDCRRDCAETCLNLYAGVDCILPECLTRCYCKPGYLRIGENGPCVPKDQCNPLECVNDVNAHRGCGDKCGKTCADYKSAPACPKPKCRTNACDCNKGFIYDENLRLCVKPENCTEPCKANEWYTPCLRKGCQPETCEDLGKPLNCPLLPPGPCPFPGGCSCKYGYVKDKNGICVDAKTCPSCGGDPNAQAGCDPCSKTCASLYSNETNPECPPCDNLSCSCKKGYYLDTDSKPPKCVLPKECPQNNIRTTPMPPVCPENEERTCRDPCPPETCLTLYAAFDCIANQTCVNGCHCKKGFLRIGQKGPCVPKDQCNPIDCVDDPNAERGCGDKCGRTCADYKTNPICPKRPCKNDGCACKEGYIYDQNLSLCVKPKDCTKPCKANERYSKCLLSECQPKTCEDLGKPIGCPAIAADPCPGGCVCDYGYVKDKDGKCIDAKTCPSCGGDPNAQAGCGNPCGKTCSSLNINKMVCPQYCESNGCDCKEGYLLNTNLKPPRCVLIKDCPESRDKCGKNEELYCGPSCPGSEASCSNPNPPICINKKCEVKCFCKKGFIRDANNTCIPADKCPKCTKPHERYIDCLAGQCNPKKCADLNEPIACPFVRDPCPGGCMCEDGYMYDSKGACIKQEDCPPKPCPANQTWMTPCNQPCPYPRCPRDDKPPPPCEVLLPCYPGCQCKLNYLRNTTGHCILAPDCPPVKCTRQNEVWDSCPSACLAESCDDVGKQPTTCNTLIWLCSPRCVCKKGHFRNKDGLCVPSCQCPAPKCPKPNEKYVDCLAGQCQAKTCDELIKPAPCPRVKPPCPGGCICIDGYVRNAAGDCIKKEECPKNCAGANELYSDCANGQCSPRTCKEVTKMPSCPSNTTCKGGCICKRGFVRSDNRTCIAIKDCPEAGTCTDPNQAWVDCAVNCGPAYCPKNDEPQFPCFLPAGICQPGCKCKPNFRIDNNNNCIPARDCPPVPCTRPNEEYNSCPGNRITSCALIGTKPVANTGPKICNPACICKEGFYKNDNGTCVTKCQCPTDTTPSD